MKVAYTERQIHLAERPTHEETIALLEATLESAGALRETPEASWANTEAGAPGPQPGRRGHETLLVVEDDPAVRNLVVAALRRDSYTLLLASSADEALALADAHHGPLDLLLTDAHMPGMSGLELANAMCTRRPGLPIIIMSGDTEDDLGIAALAKPVSLLQKPFTPRELRDRIREVLDR